MNEADFAQVIGYLFGAYGVGWGAGYLLRAFHKLAEMFR